MPDLLTHVLVGYVIGQFSQHRFSWVTKRHVTLVMVGAVVPDLNHISAVVSPEVVVATVGIPFSWVALQTGGGALLILVAVAVTFESGVRGRAFTLLWTGAVTHLLADVAISSADGRAQRVFWPLTPYRPPTPGLYQTTDLWPLTVAVVAAVVVTVMNRNDE